MSQIKTPIADRAASSYSTHFFGRSAGSIVGIIQGQSLKQLPPSLQVKQTDRELTKKAAADFSKTVAREVALEIIGHATKLSVPIAVAGFLTGELMSAIERRTQELLAEVRDDEPKAIRHLLYAAVNFGNNGDRVNAMRIAEKGATAWEHRNGLWVYASVKGNVRPIVYHPCSWQTIYTPKLPLKPVRDGFSWQILRQNRTGQTR